MNKKKAILKKYTGKGGIIGDTVREIPGTLKGMAQNLSKAVDPAGLVSKGINGIKNLGGRVMDSVEGRYKAMDAYTKNRDDKMKTEMFGSPEKYDQLQNGSPQVNSRGTLKGVIKKAMPIKNVSLTPIARK